jgi:dipeptidase D
VALKLSVTGLLGGHSGDDIDKGLGNSIKILNRILYTSHKKFEISLSDFQGGNLRNAIPREAFAIISVHKKNKDNLLEHIAASEKEIKMNLPILNPNLTFLLNL